MYLLGRDPTTSHKSSCSVPADKGLFSPCNFTHNGRTEIMKVLIYTWMFESTKIIDGKQKLLNLCTFNVSILRLHLILMYLSRVQI